VIERHPSHQEREHVGRRVTDAAFAAAIAESDERLRALAYHLLGDRDAMDDVLQEVYLKAHRRLASFRGESTLATWLYRIALTTCLDALRRQRRRRAITPAGLAAAAPQHLSLDDALAVRDQVHRALCSLPPERCVAVLLVLRDGHTYAEAAEILGVPDGTVASRVALGRKQLMRELSPDAEGGEQL
jgi:RNA polymerase sigma-70 factor, ECF subfamily